jgi:hypothetical protein
MAGEPVPVQQIFLRQGRVLIHVHSLPSFIMPQFDNVELDRTKVTYSIKLERKSYF